MSLKKILFIGTIGSSIFFSACKHEVDLSNVPTISYLTDVQPILSSNCTMSACHGTDAASEFSLVNYDEVMEYVNPGNPSRSKLYVVITKLEGEKRMPQLPAARLADAQVKKILIWIEQDAKNN